MKKIAFILVFTMLVPLCASCGKTIADENNCWFKIQHLTSNPTLLSPPCEVQFNAGSSAKPKSWDWKFSDGGTATGQNPKHIFEKEGSYSATMTATYEDGSNATLTMTNIDIYKGLVQYKKDDFSLEYRIITPDKNESISAPYIKFSISYPTNGMITMKILSADQKNMQGADVYSGLKNDKNKETGLFDCFYQADKSSISDVQGGGQESFLTKDSFEIFGINKVTILDFSRLLDTGDKCDVQLEEGKTYRFILEASGSGDDDIFSEPTKTTEFLIKL
ncbi:MAG TPA: PKD domain-containing protein [Caldisericia bacterium]|nr:MAG: PKD domain protein [bacterium ADurb.Bin132]HQL69114.1 PKD domain-containing protein [Caldisericia bacterium]